MKISRIAIAAALSCVLVGCAESNSQPDAGSSEISESDVAMALKYSGGSAGKADPSKDPFVLGFVSQYGSTPSFPEHLKAAEAAVKFVNEKLGGVDGHPVELEECVIQAEEDGQKCAAQMLANENVYITNWGLAVFGNGTFYKTVNAKFPVVVSIAGNEADYTTEHVYEFDGGGDGLFQSMIADASELDAQSVAMLSTDNPAGKFITGEVLVPKLEELGMSPKTIYLSDTSTTPDYVSALQSSGAAQADVVMLMPASASACIALYDAMKQLSIDKPVISLQQCSGDPMPEKTGGGPEGWHLSTMTDISLLDTPEAKTYRNVMTSMGAADIMNVGHAVKQFSDILTITGFANNIGFDNLSADAFEKQIADYRGPGFMVPGNMLCGGHPTYAGICGDSVSRVKYTNGKWEPAAPFTGVTLKRG